jgi:hypothetical protein
MKQSQFCQLAAIILIAPPGIGYWNIAMAAAFLVASVVMHVLREPS